MHRLLDLQGGVAKTLTELWDLLPAGVELNLIPFEDAFASLREKTIKEGEVIYG